MNNYIYVLKRNLIGETVLMLKADKVAFQRGDVIYISDKNKKIHSRWMTAKRNSKVVILAKEPEAVISVNYPEVLGEKYSQKINLLSKNDADILDKCFVHEIKIFPFYDTKSENDVQNKLLTELKKQDKQVEVYSEVIKDFGIDNKSKNLSFIIAEPFGVIGFECLEDNIFENREAFGRFSRELATEDLIKKLLLNSSILTPDGENLKIGYKKFYIVESSKDEDYYHSVNMKLNEKGFEGVSVVSIDMFIRAIDEYTLYFNKKVIMKDEHFGIMQMLMPQYINSKVVNINNDQIKFMPESSYEIDENQKTVLSNMNERVYLKASAGSGKTILLLAKAYEAAVANPEKNFLLICYNSKLAEDIRIQAENTGKVNSNLKIKTLDAFIQDEITQYKGRNDSDTFNTRREIFVTKVRTGEYNQKFGGIFIDEMQQLEEEWIAALIDCLDDNKYMILAGDYYQQIRQEDSSQDDYDDDILEDSYDDSFYIGEYSFNKILLNRNYRNTNEITQVLNKMLNQMKRYVDELQVPIDNEEKEKVIGKGIRHGVEKPRYISVSQEAEERNVIVQLVFDLIRNKEYTPNEILLVSPWGSSSSHLIYVLKKQIEDRGIRICDFENSGLYKDGIRLGTIGKAIGLDFKAVIIFGTSMLQKAREENNLLFDSYLELQKQGIPVKKAFIKNLKNIYVACSRARETLIVVDDIRNYNLMSEFLKIVGESDDEQ